jgi:tetratricopeptide (TPR) repeat protein
MAVASSVFWIAGFILSAIMGPTLKIWTWGPTMLCFAAATVCSIPNIWRGSLDKFNLYILLTGLATAAWFAGRAWFSPVEEMARIDLSLVAMAVSTFIVLQNVFSHSRAQMILIIGIALLLCANLAVMALQIRDVGYNPVIPHALSSWPTGFFRHYSHCATFLIASSLLLGGFALRGSWPRAARIVFLLLAFMGMAAVYITKSRSGMLGASGGVAALLIYWLLTGKRDDRKWSGVALVVAPIVILIITVISLSTLESVQQTRSEGSDLIDMLDNNLRLYLYGIAFSCVLLHPLTGGGSRSFSWENYQFWEIEKMGVLGADPQHVHNEFVQVFTDYGMIGAGLLSAFILGILILCTFRSLVQGNWSKYAHSDAWRIGGVAAFIGIFIQSNFEGVLRTAPGAIILAICLAAASHGHTIPKNPPTSRPWLRQLALTLCSLAFILIMCVPGYKGSGVAIYLWNDVMLTPSATHEDKISAYTRGIGKWKLESLLSERGTLYYDLAVEKGPDDGDYRNLLKKALADYQAAISLHPHTPLHPRNAANTLRLLYRYDEASKYYEKTIQLQGGMEPAYFGHFLYAGLLHELALFQLQNGNYPESVKKYELAKNHLNQTTGYIHGAKFKELQTHIYINLAQALENGGEYEKALSQYEAYDRLRGAGSANYYVAVMFYKRARNFSETQRQPDALRLFMEAEKLLKTHPQLSKHLPIENRNRLMEDIRKQILRLREENHLPSTEIRLK